MKKYLTILLLLAIALLSSCNLDNQGIFAEVIDRVPSDNRKLSFIGANSNSETTIVYFKSVNGIESYDLKNKTYEKLDSSENARKNNIFVFNKEDKEIIYFVDKATSDGVSYDSCYKLDLKDNNNTTTKLTNNSDIIFAGSYNKYLIDKEGNVYSYSIDENNEITFGIKANKIENEFYVKNIDNIFAFSTKSTDATTKNLEYYKFTGSGFTKIALSDDSNLGILRSVTTATDNVTQYLIFSEVNGQAETSLFKYDGTDLTKLGKLLSSNVRKDFESFVDSGNLYFAYDGSSSLNKYNLASGELTSTTISKLGNVAIVGYFNVIDKEYKICTANNGFLTLSLDGTPHLK